MQNGKAIIFDLGGVILNIDYGKTTDAFRSLGVKDFDDMYSQKKANPLFSSLEEGKINEQEFYDAFRRSTSTLASDEQIKLAWNAMLLGFREKALQTLQALRHKYKLYLLSNTNAIHYEAFHTICEKEIGKESLDEFFDKIYYSHNIGHRKPDREAYEIVLQENGLTPSETIFIDDSIQNIDAAKKLGLQTIFLRPGKGIEELDL